jgi:hypothetical protein
LGPVSCAPFRALDAQTNDRSTRNTRIERLWFDFTQGIGGKWKDFFIDLESNHGLLPGLPAHIWLLHWLFLDAINDDIQEWAQAWNHHRISLQGEAPRSPRDLFLFSIVQDGVRGMESSDDDEAVDPNTYGVDWEVYDDPVLVRHMVENIPDDQSEEDENLSEVDHEAFSIPLGEDLVYELELQLNNYVDLSSRNMNARRFVWQTARQICYDLQVEHGLDRYMYFLSMARHS